MNYKKLQQTEIEVSQICLGTMTFGEQNTEAEAFQQLDYALAHGINFIDTAEMYPVPPKKETYGSSEEMIGNWLQKSNKRSEIILASKIAGPTRQGTDYIRNGSRFTRQQIISACEDSLRRLKTDYLDIYQLHWPERHVNFFGQLGLQNIQDADDLTPLAETLSALDELKQAGKIRYYGVSNETPWGLMQYLNAQNRSASATQLVSIQNPYNLLNRSYEVALAEFSLRENISLLAYSPLAFGLLTGKYNAKKSAWNPEWRLAKYERFQRYNKKAGWEALARYSKIATDFNLDLTTMALAFVNQQAFVTSNIIGATDLEQLAQNIASIDCILSDEILQAINQVHAEISNPCP